MSRSLELDTTAGAHVCVHELAQLGAVGAIRVALSIDCRDFDRGMVWISLTEREARTLAAALSAEAPPT